VKGSSTRAFELHQRHNSIMETIFSTPSEGRLSVNDWMPNESGTTELDFGHLTTPTFCTEERSQMLVDENVTECSDSDNGDDNKYGTDSGLVALHSFTRPPSPRFATTSHYDSTGSPWEPRNESDTLHKLDDNLFQICSSPQCVSLESEVDRALGSPTYTSARRSPQCSSHASREDYFGSHVLESRHIENIHTTSIDMGIRPPTNTPAVATAGSSTGERRDNIHQISATTPQSLHSKLKSHYSHSTSIVDASEASYTQGHKIEPPQLNHPSLSMPSESYLGQEDSPPSTAAENDEEPSNPALAGIQSGAQDPVNLQTQRPPIASRKSTVTSSHSFYIVPRIPRLYYKHDSPSCWSILTNLLTNPIHRLRNRKRSVKESAAMDQELRELHARMRETEMRMKQDGTQVAQPPQYTVQKDDAATTTHETTEVRPNWDAR
jgi:hypothetical protein